MRTFNAAFVAGLILGMLIGFGIGLFARKTEHIQILPVERVPIFIQPTQLPPHAGNYSA